MVSVVHTSEVFVVSLHLSAGSLSHPPFAFQANTEWDCHSSTQPLDPLPHFFCQPLFCVCLRSRPVGELRTWSISQIATQASYDRKCSESLWFVCWLPALILSTHTIATAVLSLSPPKKEIPPSGGRFLVTHFLHVCLSLPLEGCAAAPRLTQDR